MLGNKEGLCSICCLGYKHVEFLETCIQHIWDQDYRNIEIIAIDDGSHDGSVELLHKLKEKSPFPMIVLEQENTGKIGMNFNRAREKANGEFIGFISLDDALYPDAISSKLQRMNVDAA